MTFKELVNKVRNLVLEAKNVTIEDTENNFTSDNVEGALKEVFQSGVNAKNNVVTALNSKGAGVTTSDTWDEINNKINSSTGRLDLRLVTDKDTSKTLMINNKSDINNDTGIRDILSDGDFYILFLNKVIKCDSDFNIIYEISKESLSISNISFICLSDEYLYIFGNTSAYKINKNSGAIELSKGDVPVNDTNGLFCYYDGNIYYTTISKLISKVDANTLDTVIRKEFTDLYSISQEMSNMIVYKNKLYFIYYPASSNIRLFYIDLEFKSLSSLYNFTNNVSHRRLMVFNDLLYLIFGQYAEGNRCMIGIEKVNENTHNLKYFNNSNKKITGITNDGNYIYAYNDTDKSILKLNSDLTLVKEYICKQNSYFSPIANITIKDNVIYGIDFSDTKNMISIINFKDYYLPKKGEDF
ncbi:tail fiber protein [Clostridioides difficile]|uniref:hypothetical protein n=1 Tax=Clostridioides difficile TaxID=1496 RepID=UPI001025CB21|nr:hypothetical protein [Clostridioides difficile]VFC53505.1 tail fiber protein [Clostridioides difficile]VHX67858.1 tail fiber protein [Clostridioides difficile]